MEFEPIRRTVRNAAAAREGKRDWFRFQNLATGETRIDIYDEISWWGITAADFNRELKAVTSNRINLHINSIGGDVFDGIAIYNALKQHSAEVHVSVDALAASIASVIAMAGDTVEMAKGAMMMIHEPFALVIGDAADMRKQADALDLMGDSIAGIYADRAGETKEDWRGRMRDETWYSDTSAVEAGLADVISGEVAAKNTFDLSIFRNYPSRDERTDKPEPKRNWRHDARSRIAAARLEVARVYAH